MEQLGSRRSGFFRCYRLNNGLANVHRARDRYGSPYLRVVETKGRLGLRDSNLTRDLRDVLVEFATNVIVVAEDERLL